MVTSISSQRRRKIPTPPGFLGVKAVTVYDPVTGRPVRATARVFRTPTVEERLDRDWIHTSWQCSIFGVGQSQQADTEE